jgi:hypothetical protein
MRVERTLVGLLLTTAVALSGCQGKLAYNLPPSPRLMEPGPGVGGPGPGVIPPAYGAGMMGGGMMGGGMTGGGVYPGAYANDGGVCQANYTDGGGEYGGGSCICGGRGCDACRGGLLGRLGDRLHGGGSGGFAPAGYMMGAPTTSQVAFLGSDGVQVSWDVGSAGTFDSVPLVIPGRQDFYQGAIYRLRLSNIPGRPGVELYPTLEVAPVTPRTDAYLAHSPIPIQFTEEDFDQALSGNFVTKVIYLPDPEFQELALAGVETLVSTRLPPGTDPIAEADHRGAILAIVRLGNKDLRSATSGSVVTPQQGVPAEFGIEPAAYQMPSDDGVVPAQYCYGGGDGNMPLGMPTAGFAPPAVPPNMIAGPEWGMPMSGTPIGLPGPPHIPLGTPAGLQQHVMKNRTRVVMPPPVAKVNVTVKQRPGLNYPRPVNRVRIDETRREPLRLVPGWLSGLFEHHNAGNAYNADCN